MYYCLATKYNEIFQCTRFEKWIKYLRHMLTNKNVYFPGANVDQFLTSF